MKLKTGTARESPAPQAGDAGESEVMSDDVHLCESTLPMLNADIPLLGYDRSTITTGIVHIGAGAFHRAHQAWYTHQVLQLYGEQHWGICEIAMHSTNVRDALAPQDNLYMLAQLNHEIAAGNVQRGLRVIGAITDFLVAPEKPSAAIDRLALESTKVVTLTITEKGYCLNREYGLNVVDKDILHDLANLGRPITAIGLLAAAFAKRKEYGIPPFVTVSCDNLPDNGKCVRTAVAQFCENLPEGSGGVELAAWVREAHFPCTMVDSICPATEQGLVDVVHKFSGVRDNWPVQRESFTQWVIEDIPGMELPPWDKVGVQLSSQVKLWEMVKLRVLNGLHTSMCFVGILSGYQTVRETVQTSHVHGFLEKLVLTEIIPTVTAPDGLDLKEYAHTVMQRFGNASISHYLEQIAFDSSQKIPVRILDTIADNLAAGRRCPLMAVALAAWIRFIEKRTEDCDRGNTWPGIRDKLVETLKGTARACRPQREKPIMPGTQVGKFLAMEEVFPPALARNVQLVADMNAAYTHITDPEFEPNNDLEGVQAAIKFAMGSDD